MLNRGESVTADRTHAIEALLAETEVAHGAYEQAELNGVYDREWPRWYAAYAVEHGIGTFVGREVTADELATFLTRTFGEFQHADPKPTEPWSTYTARRIAGDL
jgi:hypothetical protein